MPSSAPGSPFGYRGFRELRLVRILASLPLALAVMATLAVVLSVGTFVESRYDGEMARLVLYDRWYFRLLLALLFGNVLFAVLVRMPLRSSQHGFATTHLGLLVLLVGAFVTRLAGVDGRLSLEEGDASLALQLPEPVLRGYLDGKMLAERPVPRGLFRRDGDLGPVPGAPGAKVMAFLPFAKIRQHVVAHRGGDPVVDALLLSGGGAATPLRLALDDPRVPDQADLGLMGVRLERVNSAAAFLDTAGRTPGKLSFRLAEGKDTVRLSRADLAPGRAVRAGRLAARVLEFLPDARLGAEGRGLETASQALRNPVLRLEVAAGGERWEEILYARVPDFRFSGDRHPGLSVWIDYAPPEGASETPLLRLAAGEGGALLVRCESGGRILSVFRSGSGDSARLPFGVLSLAVLSWHPEGEVRDSCLPVDPAPGRPLPPSAVRVSAGPWGGARWLPLGSWIEWREGSRRRSVSFETRRVSLPFALRLDRFTVGTDPGTLQPASYESKVTVLDPSGRVLDTATIAMNRPYRRAGFTVYQASFARDPGRKPVSTFSVNRDPGRPLKYAGSLVTVLGIVWHVLSRSRLKRREEKNV